MQRVDSLVFASVVCGATGMGMGFASTTLMIVIQGAVEWQRRATVTGLVQFSRTIGGSVGVGIMGGVVAAFVGTASSAILDPIGRQHLDAAALAAGRSSLADGLGIAYWLMLAAALGALLLAVRAMPDARLGEAAG